MPRLQPAPSGAAAAPGFGEPAAGSRLARLGAKTPKPGEYYVDDEDLVINELLQRGASRSGLEAKVFGGAAVISGMSAPNVGERNTHFVLDYLKTEHITVVSKVVLGICPRKVCFLPASGKAMVKRLAPTSSEVVVALDRAAVELAAGSGHGGGSVNLF